MASAGPSSRWEEVPLGAGEEEEDEAKPVVSYPPEEPPAKRQKEDPASPRIEELLRGVDFVRFEFTDLHGISRSKCVPARHLRQERGAATERINPQDMFIYGGVLGMSTTSVPIMFDEVLDGGCCRNVPLLPDWSSFRVLPALGRKEARFTTGRVLCSMGGLSAEEEELPEHPRNLCMKLLGELRAKNLAILGTFEYEFTLGKKNASGELKPLFSTRPTFSTTEFSRIEDMLYEFDAALLELGIEVHTMNIEYGQGQVEITTKPVFGIASADNAFTFRSFAKEFFARKDLVATFMCKPLDDPHGACNGGHFNHSLWAVGASAEGANMFADEGFTCSWIKGALEHSNALQALAAPTVSCYNRVVAWSWAPTSASWGVENRTCSLRYKKGGKKGSYLEWRAPSASANPYLVLAGLLAGGLHFVGDRPADGFESLPCGKDGLRGSAYDDSEACPLPTNLTTSLDALKADSYMESMLGSRFIRWFDKVKRKEIESVGGDATVESCQQQYLDLL